ncbi:helix-turn-helix domain-containing protein [Liquorilactobacillus satsumensis]|uniref:helix-turn-helix domain-containing protein n=1 Tax=Liquorilactobacillus satsumensis TaxID=259059 RepID=UPI0039E9D6D1
MEEQPNYYAIIPANVRYDDRLPSKAPLLYGEITTLCNKEGYCWATDDYFARIYHTDKRTIQRWLSSLEKFGYIKRKIKKEDNVIIKRYISILPSDKNVTDRQKCQYPNDKNVINPSDKNVRDIITSKSNNTSINKTHSAANAAQCANDSSKKDLQKDFEEVWSKYPNKKGKEQAFNHYKAWRKKSKLNTNAYLLDKLNKYLKYIVANKSWYHAMNGSTWFNGRFEDDLEVTNIRTPETKKDWFKGLND